MPRMACNQHMPAPMGTRKHLNYLIYDYNKAKSPEATQTLEETFDAESTVETYAQMGVIVPPIVCQEANSYPNAEGAACMCAAVCHHAGRRVAYAPRAARPPCSATTSPRPQCSSTPLSRARARSLPRP